ncbi:MAG: hypothetical protein AABW56_02620 [Nanoarchaeota archaeon]
MKFLWWNIGKSPEEKARLLEEKKDIEFFHAEIQKIINQYDNILKNLSIQKVPNRKDLTIMLKSLLEKVKRIKVKLEEAHAYIKNDNMPSCINELVDINEFFDKNIESMREHFDILINMNKPARKGEQRRLGLSETDKSNLNSLYSIIRTLVKNYANRG